MVSLEERFNNETIENITYEWKWYDKVFNHPKIELCKLYISYQDKQLKNNTDAMNFQLQYNVYIILFNIWFIAILFNQISNVGNLEYSNDSRLSNTMHILIDICHTLFTSIPFLWSQYNNYESEFWGISSPVKFQNNQYTYSTLSVFIICGFSFIFIQRLMILMKEEMIAWYKSIKLLLILFWINFIWGNYILDVLAPTPHPPQGRGWG